MTSTKEAWGIGNRTFAFCFALAVLEGVDLQSLGVAAQGLRSELNLTPQQFGYAASAGSIGLLFGAALGGRLADKIGRRTVLLVAAALFGVLSIATAHAHNYELLLTARFATGLGLGGCLPMLIALSAEAAPAGRRTFVVTMMTMAMPLGGVLASLIALHDDGWRDVFYFGGVLPILLVPLAYKYMPESVEFSAISKGGSVAPALPSISRILFGDGRASTTLFLWGAFFASLVVLYVMLNWQTSLLVAKGFSRDESFVIQMAFNLGGMIGAPILGWFVDNKSVRWTMAIAYTGIAIGLIAIALLEHNIVHAVIADLFVGAFVNGSTFVLYGLAALYYSTAMRGTGAGWAVAAGRFGSIAGPMYAGVLVGASLPVAQVLLLILPVVLIACVSALLLVRRPPSYL